MKPGAEPWIISGVLQGTNHAWRQAQEWGWRGQWVKGAYLQVTLSPLPSSPPPTCQGGSPTVFPVLLAPKLH